MFNQKYSNKRVFCLKYSLLFSFFNVVVIPVEELSQDHSIVLQSEYSCHLAWTELSKRERLDQSLSAVLGVLSWLCWSYLMPAVYLQFVSDVWIQLCWYYTK